MILARIASTPMSQITQFLPDRWNAALRAESQTPGHKGM